MTPLKITDVRAVPGDSAFLLDDGKTAILYDSGFGFTAHKVAEHIEKVLGTRPLDYILLTHSHYDHALGAPYIARKYPNAKIVASSYAAKIFGKPTAKAVMRELDNKAAAEYGAAVCEDLTDGLRADIVVEDGDVITCGDMKFTVIGLPGHTRCSVGYYLEQNQLLLGAETLGVYFGKGTYLPSCLIGYQITLDSLEKAKQLDIRQMLLPHYGVVEGEELQTYLKRSEEVVKETAEQIVSLFRAGKSAEEILEILTETGYPAHVQEVYPIDAYRLNTGIIIELVRRELNS